MGKNAWIHQSVREIFQRSYRIHKNRICLTSRGCFLSPRAIYCLCAKYRHPCFQSVFKLIMPRPEPLIFSSTTRSVSSLPNLAGNNSITILPSEVSLSSFFTPNPSHCEVPWALLQNTLPLMITTIHTLSPCPLPWAPPARFQVIGSRESLRNVWKITLCASQRVSCAEQKLCSLWCLTGFCTFLPPPGFCLILFRL